MGKNQHVVPVGNEWGVRGEGNSRLTSIRPTQAECIDIGREIAQNNSPNSSSIAAMVRFATRTATGTTLSRLAGKRFRSPVAKAILGEK